MFAFFVGWLRPLALLLAILANYSLPAIAQSPLLASKQFVELQAKPSDAEAAYQFAKEALRQGEVVTAVAALERLLLINPDLDNIRLELADLYVRSGNYPSAQLYVEAALKSPKMPAEQRVRGERILEEARREQSPYRLSGFGFFGLRHETNANNATTNDQVLMFNPFGGFQLVQLDTKARADWSAVANGAINYRYGFGNQGGDNLEFNAYGSLVRHFELDERDTGVLAVDIGPKLTPNYADGGRFSWRPFVSAGVVTQQQEVYLRYGGGGIETAIPLSRSFVLLTSLSGEYEEYGNTKPSPRADLQTGPRATARVRLNQSLDSNQLLWYGAQAIYKNADADFETYRAAGVSIGYLIRYKLPWVATPAPLTTSLTGSFDYLDYRGADPFINPFNERLDRIWRIGLNTSIPITTSLELSADISYTSRASNYDIYDYNNLATTIGFVVRF